MRPVAREAPRAAAAWVVSTVAAMMEEEPRAEDAAAPRLAPSAYSLRRAAREAHAATHMPFRSWCPECVMVRSDKPLRRAVPVGEEGSCMLPDIHLDCALLRRGDSEEPIKLLVMKSLPSLACLLYTSPSPRD